MTSAPSRRGASRPSVVLALLRCRRALAITLARVPAGARCRTGSRLVVGRPDSARRRHVRQERRALAAGVSLRSTPACFARTGRQRARARPGPELSSPGRRPLMRGAMPGAGSATSPCQKQRPSAAQLARCSTPCDVRHGARIGHRRPAMTPESSTEAGVRDVESLFRHGCSVGGTAWHCRPAKKARNRSAPSCGTCRRWPRSLARRTSRILVRQSSRPPARRAR